VAGDEGREPNQAVGPAAAAAGWSHRHRDVSGGWLRPTVFGAVDGLVTNASLIAGLGGGGVSAHAVVLTGVAALVAGAFSMGTGEYVSVTNQNELVHAEVAVERTMHAQFPAAEQAELADTFRGYGADPETAARMAAAVSRDPDTALRVHTRQELGVDSGFTPQGYLLPCFTEDDVTIEMVQWDGTGGPAHRFQPDRTSLAFVLKGAVTAAGQSCGTQTAIWSDFGESRELSGDAGAEAIVIGLPVARPGT